MAHPVTFAVGAAFAIFGIILAGGVVVGLPFVLRPSLREDHPLWALGCAAPFAVIGGLLLGLMGLYLMAGAVNENAFR